MLYSLMNEVIVGVSFLCNFANKKQSICVYCTSLNVKTLRITFIV